MKKNTNSQSDFDRKSTGDIFTLFNIAKYIQSFTHNYKNVNTNNVDDGFISYSDNLENSEKIEDLIDNLENSKWSDRISIDLEKTDKSITFKVSLLQYHPR